jgi:hypothetical protein
MKKMLLLLTVTTLSAMAMTEEESAEAVVAALAAMGMMLLILGVVGFVVQIFFILSVNKTIRAFRTEQSTASVVMAWLMIIPLIGWAFAIITVVQLAADYKSYVREHRLTKLYQRDGGLMKGLIAFIASICSFVPVIGPVAVIVGLVFFILYWIELGDLRKSIEFARPNTEE